MVGGVDVPHDHGLAVLEVELLADVWGAIERDDERGPAARVDDDEAVREHGKSSLSSCLTEMPQSSASPAGPVAVLAFRALVDDALDVLRFTRDEMSHRAGTSAAGPFHLSGPGSRVVPSAD